jgi:hypothetical protein
MDWRLIAALSAAGGSFCFVAVGAYVVLTANPAQQRTMVPAAPAPMLLSEYRPSAPSAPLLVNMQAAISSPFAPESNAASAIAVGGVGASGRVGTSGAAPAVHPSRIADDSNKSPTGRAEPKQEPRTIGYKTATLTPFDAGTRPEPPRPVVEVKKSTVVPELHAALPATHYRGVLTSAEIFRIRHNLRLTPDQEPAWPAVEAALAEIGRQQIALLRRGQEPRISQSEWPPGRLYGVAGPLLQTLRPDQKETVRRLCRSLGFDNIASMI